VTGDFQRYLRAKRTVDDRALDRRLVDQLRAGLADRAGGSGPLRVLEVGAGIGTMLTRFLEWDVLPSADVRYTALDVQPDNVAGIESHLREWANGRSVSVSTAGAAGLILDGPERRITVEPVAAEGAAFAERTAGGWDAVVGAALLDILDVAQLDSLLGAVAPRGLWYFPITFDGATRFRPTHPADRAVETRYHDHMDAKPGGDSRAGGTVLDHLRDTPGVDLVGVAGSDWVVRPVDGAYPGDEAYFLRHILDTVEGALGELADPAPADLDDWLARRRRQVDEAELTYRTHQLDFLGRTVGPELVAGSTR
jgi:hypothetical protein